MILGCAISSIACAKHGCTGGWLILCHLIWLNLQSCDTGWIHSHECYGFANQQQPDNFFQQIVQCHNLVNIKAPHYWLSARESQKWLVDSPHKWPLMQKAFPCHDVIIDKNVSLAFRCTWCRKWGGWTGFYAPHPHISGTQTWHSSMAGQHWKTIINPLHAKFFRVNINMYLHFM